MTAAIALYDRLAPRYERLHRRWLAHAGGEAQAALEGAVRATLRPGDRWLDAGCGTGRLARRMIEEGVDPAHVTLLDASAAMLARGGDLPVRRSRARLEAIPFADGAFDCVTCAWALETADDPHAALGGLVRVLRPGGMLCLAFCAARPDAGVAGRAMRRAVERRGAGRFLAPGTVAAALLAHGAGWVRAVPCGGPAAVLLARRGA